MKVYLTTTSDATSEQIPEKYLKRAKKEQCIYWESIPSAYLSNPEKYGWPAEVPERFKESVEVCAESIINNKGCEVLWTKFSYLGHRYYLEISGLDELEDIISEFGGYVTFHKRGLENSSKIYSQDDCECLLGLPDIGNAIVLEINEMEKQICNL